ncbi:MAG: TonB-dependent receptor [Gemmatimonadota bacterium]
MQIQVSGARLAAGLPVSFSIQSATLLTTLLLMGFWTIPLETRAQARTGTVTGEVVTEGSGAPLQSVSVSVDGTGRGAVTDSDGVVLIEGVPAGLQTVTARMLGYRTAAQEVEVVPGETVRVVFSLRSRPLEVGGIRVSVLRPDLQPRAELSERELRRANPKDAGQLLRRVGGVDAVRRGPLGLDPVVRGLRETEVGTYLDGTRLFPAGPARMDSPLTHLDPSAVSTMEVVKGPYALTWGAGNLSAIRVETERLPDRHHHGVRGRASTGYDSNLDARELFGTLSGRSGRVSYWTHAAYRDGGDYTSGGDERVPGDFESWEGRAKLGVDVHPESRLTLSAGYQEQGSLDYPGRLLNADFFEALNLSARWQTERSSGLLRDLDVLLYRNQVDHGMGNWEKPTAMPMEGRMPPFALDVGVDSSIEVWGARLAGVLQQGPWSLRVGGDLYSANRDAQRTIRRQDNGALLFEDLMWPDATVTDGGLFAQASRTLDGRVRLAGTLRLDLVRAEADTASDFFLENVSRDLTGTETNLSAAVTAGFDLGSDWNLSLGVGSAVRTADATERYSDRSPASKAQTSAEFVGNPALEPERSTQADLWLEGRLPNTAVQLNLFGRWMQDYITIEATDLPKRLPLSPETVFRYVNGDATFWGGEASVVQGVTDRVTLEASSAYLWARDDELDEPVLGIAPLSGRLGLRFEDSEGRYYLEGTLLAVSDQDRAATTRGESPTDGYTTVDLGVGWAPGQGVNLRLGIENLLDEGYVNHLNARNPFTGIRIPEPGRVFFVKISYGF